MIPFYKTYISALLHNPNLLTFGSIDIEAIQKENDATAESSVNLLVWSKYLSRNQSKTNSVWSSSCFSTDKTIYPPFHNLYAFITGNEVCLFEKADIFRYFRKEIIFLRQIYKNVEPDKKTMYSKPLIIDLFGDVHEKYEVEIKEPKILNWWDLPPKHHETISWISH